MGPLRPLLFASTASAAAASRWFLLAVRTGRDDSRRITCRGCSTLRNNPELNQQLWQTSAIDYYQATGINATSVDEVVLGAIRSRRTLGIAAAIANDVALSSWLVLQLNREVVEPGL